MYSPQLYIVGLAAVGFIVTLIVARICVHRWVRWATRVADYGTTAILGAEYIDSEEAVARLRTEFEAWSLLVKDGTARFCLDGDAHRVHFFSTSPSPDVTGFNDEHRYIRDATAERVRRLRELAARLEQGQPALREVWVPRIN